MDSSGAEAVAHSETREDAAPSTSHPTGPADDGPKPKKASLKRPRGKQANAKVKKPKKARGPPGSQLGYTVHQGEDMLLVISSSTSHYGGSAWTPPKKGNKKKKLKKGKAKAAQIKKKKTVRAKPKPVSHLVAEKAEDAPLSEPQRQTDHRWGESLPEEVLINIFQMVVNQDGAVPFLCR